MFDLHLKADRFDEDGQAMVEVAARRIASSIAC
jgi:hypothetical protein